MKPQYVAVREQSTEKHQHYHVALMLDGQKTQNIHNHIATAERLWDSTLGLPEPALLSKYAPETYASTNSAIGDKESD